MKYKFKPNINPKDFPQVYDAEIVYRLKSGISCEAHPELYDIECEVGEKLYCHTDLIMQRDGRIEATKGDIYTVINTTGGGIDIKNNSGEPHLIPSDSINSWFRPATPAEIEAENKKFSYEYQSEPYKIYKYSVRKGEENPEQLIIANEDGYVFFLPKSAYLEIGKRTGWSS